MASVVATQIDPLLVMIVAAAGVGIGAVLLARLHSTQPPPHPDGEARRPTVLRQPGIVLMCLVALAMGAIFASAEVAMVAFCGQHGAQSLTGPVLAAMALGSAIAGLWYGGRTWARPLIDRFRIQAVLFGIVPWVFLAAFDVGSLAACALIVGLAVAPALITLFSLVSRARRERRADRGAGLGADRAQCRLRHRGRRHRADLGCLGHPGGVRGHDRLGHRAGAACTAFARDDGKIRACRSTGMTPWSFACTSWARPTASSPC